jgi:hypothetical protein
MPVRFIQALAAGLALASLAACTTLTGGVGGARAVTGPAGDCLVFLDELDRVVDLEGSRDGGEHRIAGFPYLRVDRFTASFGADANADDVRYRAWVERMRAIDDEARGYEIANLPDEAFPVLRTLSREQVVARSRTCGKLLVDEHAMKPVQRQRLPGLAVVPDDYSTVKRVLGLYALTGMPFAASERHWQRRTREVFASQRTAPAPAKIAFQRYAPGDRPVDAAAAIAQAREVMAGAGVDALGIPRLDEAAAQRLLAAYAPSFEIGTSAEYDRFGPLQWIDLEGLVAPDAERYWLDVDPSQPVVYRRLAFTRYGKAVLTQLVYTVWFSERPLQESGDLLGGRLDGLVWRVTLDEHGEPLLFDTIQPSGRFGMFFPTARMRLKPSPENDPLIEWAYSPIDQPIEQWVGGGAALAGVSLHISSQTHQLVGVARPGAKWGEPISRDSTYRMVPEDRLRALPLPGRGSRSIFGPDGIVPNTERSARYFFWPLGIASPGSMRQWGRQPTAFIGRRHFDDADLLEKRFELTR